MASSSVQFFGKDKVLLAYSSRSVDVWSVFQGKQFIHAGEGEEQLNQFLTMLEPSGTQAVYTLKVYPDLQDASEVTDRTESKGSFNFKLFQYSAMAAMTTPGALSGAAPVDAITARINAVVSQQIGDLVEKKFADKDEPDESEGDTIGGIVMGYLREPDKLIGVIHALKGLFSPGAMGAPAMVPVQLAAAPAVGTIGAAEQGLSAMQESNIERLSKVLDRLERCDPNILEHLEKLADMAEKNPAKYNMAISLL